MKGELSSPGRGKEREKEIGGEKDGGRKEKEKEEGGEKGRKE